MVPVEPISLSIAVATLFTTCIECFEYFKAAQGFEQHFEVLLVKLEYQQERLLVWGDLAGICDENRRSVGPVPEREHKRQDRTKRCLDSIKHLLKDTETLKSKYGLRVYAPTGDTVSRSGITSNALKRFRLRLGRQSQGPSVLDKTRWAIHDATKFQELVQDIRDLIDGLMTEVPLSPDLQEQKVQDDIASMMDDIESLHLFQEACKDDYPKWWTAANAAINASEVATLDNRLADERLEHCDTSTRYDTNVGVNNSVLPYHFGDRHNEVYLNTRMQIFFISTQSCRLQDSETPCDQISLGRMSFLGGDSFIAPGSVHTRSAPGYRITKYIDPSNFTHVDLEKYVENQNAMRAHAIANDEIAPETHDRYHVKVFIYCPPCACQIATALDICLYRDKKDFVDFYIRIEHRLKTCCSASFSRIEGLVSVVDYITRIEIGSSLLDKTVEKLQAIDREWLERQIYDYAEADRFETLSPADQLTRIARAHKSNPDPSTAAIIMLGEVDYSVPLMGAPPFRPFESGRLPRENQLFRNWLGSQCSWEMEFLGTYSAKYPLPPKRPAPVDSSTAQTLERAQRGSKRPRSSVSDKEGS